MSKERSGESKSGDPKRLVIMRHGKAERLNIGGDHSRELTSRGHRNAAEMGAMIAELIGKPDAIIASDAARARGTAEDVARALDFDHDLILEPSIYAASLEQLVRIIHQFDDRLTTVIIVGHNPEFEDLVQWLGGEGPGYDHLPTAGVVVADIDAPTWRAFGDAPVTLSPLFAPSRKASAAGDPEAVD